MDANDHAAPRQAVAAAFVGLLSPMIRRFPRTLAAAAGRSAWLSVLLAAPLLLPVVGLMRAAAARLLQGEAVGRRPVRLFCASYALWLLLYSGFLLRSGAERFVTTVYPRSGSTVFLLCMAAVCALAASGGFRPVARMAMVLRPLLLAIPVLLFLLVLRDLDFGILLPVRGTDLLPNLFAAGEIVNLCAASGFLLFSGLAEPASLRPRDWAGWGSALIGLLGLMTCACLGMFGPELTASLSYPFFLLARDAPALGTLEHMEPLIVAVWIFADTVFLASLLRGAALLLRVSLFPRHPAPPVWLTPLCGVLALTAGLLLPSGRGAFRLLSERAVPIAAAVMNLALPLLAALAASKRRS